MREVAEVAALLSQKSSLLLLTEMVDNPALVTNVLDRLTMAVAEWEDQEVMLDPVEFEIVTDVLVKQFAASFLAAQAIINRCQCALGDVDDDEDGSDEA
jgi:hypothetical protein